MKRPSFLIRPLLLFVSFCIGISIVTIIRNVGINSSLGPKSEIQVSEIPPQVQPLSDLPESTPTPENTSLLDKTPEYLCDNLVELKKMPWSPHWHSGDAIYDALKRKGIQAIPCLVGKITDTRPAEYPISAPFWSGLTYRVGDTAVNMLMDINEMYWPKGMLPKKYERMFKDEGMFSYYFYVDEVPDARKEVQRWWRNWMKTCRPECAKVPSLEN